MILITSSSPSFVGLLLPIRLSRNLSISVIPQLSLRNDCTSSYPISACILLLPVISYLCLYPKDNCSFHIMHNSTKNPSLHLLYSLCCNLLHLFDISSLYTYFGYVSYISSLSLITLSIPLISVTAIFFASSIDLVCTNCI